MLKRVLGRTGYEVSVVGFGGIPIQRLTQEEVTILLQTAYENGINFIDTSIRYTVSEEFIGNALQIVGREHFFVTTKSMSKTREGILAELEKSMAKLKIDYLDLYQFHNPKNLQELELILEPNGALDAVKEMKKESKIREIGISSHSLEVLFAAIETNEFATIQYPYNAVERQGEELFKLANQRNIGVIAMKPLAGGSITKGESAIRFILENKNVSVVIPGMEKVEQIEENTKPGIDGRGLNEIERLELFTEAELLGNEFCRRCGYCTPCSVGIDIPGQFILDGYLMRYNLGDWANDRYFRQDIKASDCIMCGMCLLRCPYNLPIIDMLKRVTENFSKR